MGTVFDILIPLALLAVTITLGFGIYALYRGGDFGRSYSNKLMRLRIVLQAIAVILLVAAIAWKAPRRRLIAWSSSTASTPAPATAATPA